MKAAVFTGDEAFEARDAALAWCAARGIAVGISEGPQPRGLMVGTEWTVAKWSNLLQHDRATLDGVMRGDMRHGPVEIWLEDRVDLSRLEAEAGLLPSGSVQ